MIENRLIKIEISAKPINISITKFYTPITAAEDEAVDVVYDQLETLLREIATDNNTIIIGDWNAVAVGG